MKKPEHCAKEEALVPAVEAGGLDEIRIMQIDEHVFVMSVKIKTKREWTYLSTRRHPDQPRQFKKIEAAVAVGKRLFKAKKFTVSVL